MGALKEELFRPATIVIISVLVVIFAGGLILGGQGYVWLRGEWRDDLATHHTTGMHDEAKSEFAAVRRDMKAQAKATNDKLDIVIQGLVAKGIIPPKR